MNRKRKQWILKQKLTLLEVDKFSHGTKLLIKEIFKSYWPYLPPDHRIWEGKIPSLDCGRICSVISNVQSTLYRNRNIPMTISLSPTLLLCLRGPMTLNVLFIFDSATKTPFVILRFMGLCNWAQYSPPDWQLWPVIQRLVSGWRSHPEFSLRHTLPTVHL